MAGDLTVLRWRGTGLRRVLVAAFVSTILLPGCVSSSSLKSWPSVQQLAAWHAAPEFTQQLTKELNLTASEPRFLMHFPAEYDLQVSEVGRKKMVLARGHERSDGTKTAMVVSAIPRTAEQRHLSLTASMQLFLDAIRAGRSAKWHQAQPEQGTVEGQPFIRCKWTGVEPVTGKVMRGFVYLTVLADDYVVVSAQDTQEQAGTLPVLDATALSFRRIR